MENIINKFNLKSLKKKENIIEFTKEIFEVSKQKLNVKSGEINFKKLEHGNAYKYENTVTLNLKNFKLKNLHTIVNSVFHETRHLYQSQNRTPKNLNECKTPSLPLENSTDFVYLIDEELTQLNPFYLYYTTQTEKDARDYAHFETYKFFRTLKNNTPQEDKKLHKFLDSQIKKIQIEKQKEEQDYKTRLARLKLFENNLSQKIHMFAGYVFTTTTKAFMDTINAKTEKEKQAAQKTIDLLPKNYSAILTIYSDPELTNELLDYAIEHKNINCIYSILNSNFTNINSDIQGKIFSYIKENNINIEEVKEHLTNISTTQFLEEYNKFLTPQTEPSQIYFSDEDAKKYLEIKIKHKQNIEEELEK